MDEQILSAALDLFIESGVEGTSIERIAKRAGVGKLTVYRRWSSKEELIAQAVESLRGEAVPDEPADAPLAEQVERLLPRWADAMVRPRFRAMVARIFGSSAHHPELMAAYWENHVVPRRRTAHALLEQAKREGALSADTDVEVLIDMMVGGVLFRLLQPGNPDAAEMRRYLESVYRQAGLPVGNHSSTRPVQD
ncbi:TetR/AcrR family transcriptional regulator [Saccharopolyspora taberi]|uniref:TetR/AcrR family transcriptional regulator n=1 Tax=Saccharopolyspora taberi TaxID=60895 RepID=A0ABN3V6T0_9PSEU